MDINRNGKFATKCEESAWHFPNGPTSHFPTNSCVPFGFHFFLIVLLSLALGNSSLMLGSSHSCLLSRNLWDDPSIWLEMDINRNGKFATKCEESAWHFPNGPTSCFPTNSYVPFGFHFFLIVLLSLALGNSSLMMRKVFALGTSTYTTVFSTRSSLWALY